MEKEQASNAIREIFAMCHHIDGKSIKLLPPDTNDSLSKGFQIHIEASSPEFEQCITSIANHNNISLHKEGNLLVIY